MTASTSYNSITNFQHVNYSNNKISFNGIKKTYGALNTPGEKDVFEYQKNNYYRLPYLKNEEIVQQDEFSTTIIDKYHPKSIIDKLTKKKYVETIYDLPLRLHDELQKQKTDTVKQSQPNDVLLATGLDEQSFINNVDKINALIAMIHPKYDLFEAQTSQVFDFNIGNATAHITRITQGLTGVIYKIEIPNCKPLALKHYLNPYDQNSSEGPFPEIAMAHKLNEAKVTNIPKLYYANPYNGWMLSEYVDENTELKDGNITFEEYINKNNLDCKDINSGMAIKNSNGLFFVDYGYIYPNNSKSCSAELNSEVNQYKINKYNNPACQELTLSDIENINVYRISYVKYSAFNPLDLDFFNKTCQALRYVMQNKDIPEELSADLEKIYKEFGVKSNAIDLLKSANQ